MTEAVTQLTSSHNANKLAARSTADAENSDNSDSGEGDEENDRRNMVTIYEIDYRLYNEIDVAASFPSHQETSLSSVTTAGKPEDDRMMGSVFKELFFASMSPSIRSTDIKLQKIQRNMLKKAGCFIKLLSQLPNILKTNGDHKDEKLEAIQTFLDGIKMCGHAT